MPIPSCTNNNESGLRLPLLFAFYTCLLTGKMHYKELFKSISGISERMLVAKLRELEQHGLVKRIIVDSGHGDPPAKQAIRVRAVCGFKNTKVIDLFLLFFFSGIRLSVRYVVHLLSVCQGLHQRALGH